MPQSKFQNEENHLVDHLLVIAIMAIALLALAMITFGLELK